MTGRLTKYYNVWYVISFNYSNHRYIYYLLHPDDVKQIEQDSYLFDNIEARIAAYPDVEFEKVSEYAKLIPQLILKKDEIDNLPLNEQDPQHNTMIFGLPDEILKLCANGDIYVKGKLVENDIEVVEGLREFLSQVNKKTEESWDDIHEEYSKDEYPAFGGPFTHAMTFIEWLKLNYNPPTKKSTK
jgi:hypothetical protein